MKFKVQKVRIMNFLGNYSLCCFGMIINNCIYYVVKLVVTCLKQQVLHFLKVLARLALSEGEKKKIAGNKTFIYNSNSC